MSQSLVDKFAIEQRRRECLQLRIAGASMGKIAQQMQLSKSTVHGHIKRALSDLAEKDSEATARYRNLNMQRLDALLLAIWGAATKGDNPAATREARFLVIAQSKLLGLEAPTKVAFTDPTGEFERKPSDWIMPVPPEQDPQTWASDMQQMMAKREETAQQAVAEVLERAGVAPAS